MRIKELTLGEELAVEVGRSDYDFKELADVCNEFERYSRTTYAELLKLTDVPEKRAPRWRLYLLLLALGLEPSEYGLTRADRNRLWPANDASLGTTWLYLKRRHAVGQLRPFLDDRTYR